MDAETISASGGEVVCRLPITRNDQPVRAWLAAVSSSAYARLSLLSHEILRAPEQVRWANFPAEKRRVTFLLGRYAAKRAAAAYLGMASIIELEMAGGVFDQPILRYAAHDLPHITLCHTNDLALAIAYQSDHIFGIDCETIDAARCDILQPQTTTAEAAMLQAFDLNEAQRLFLLWTAKEALSKALRCGLTLSFPLLEINRCAQVGPGDYRFEFANFSQYQARCCLLRNCAAAIVFPRRSELGGSLPGLLADLGA